MGAIGVFSRNPNVWRRRDAIGASLSGEGSTLERTRMIRQKLAELVIEFDIRSIADAPCGDLFWMSHFLKDHPGVSYVGFDAMAASIEAARRRIEDMGLTNARVEHADLADTALPRVDLILERDGLQHLPNWEALQAMRNYVDSGSRYLVATVNLTDPRRHNREIRIGGYRPVNYLIPPFSLPSPIAIYPEQSGGELLNKQKYFGIWDLDVVRAAYRAGEAPWHAPKPTIASRIGAGLARCRRRFLTPDAR